MKVIARGPAELVSGSGIDIYSVDTREHLPATAGVLRFIVWHPALQHQGCVRAQVEQIVLRQGCGRTDDVTTEANGGSLLERQQMRAHDILEIHASVEKLVGLDVAIVVGLSRLCLVILFR